MPGAPRSQVEMMLAYLELVDEARAAAHKAATERRRHTSPKWARIHNSVDKAAAAIARLADPKL